MSESAVQRQLRAFLGQDTPNASGSLFFKRGRVQKSYALLEPSKIIRFVGTIENHTLTKAYDFGTILLFSSISTRRTTYSPIKLARKVGTVHTKIVLDYDSRRVTSFFASIWTKITKWFQNHTLLKKRMIFDGSNKAYDFGTFPQKKTPHF